MHVSGSGATTGVGVGTASYGDAAIEVGSGALGNHYSYIDLTGDTTYTDYGVRLIRTSSGANALGQLSVRGMGGLYLTTVEAGPMVFQTSNTTRMRSIDAIWRAVARSRSSRAMMPAISRLKA